MSLDDALQQLVNIELNAVAFVMDYVEFHFNGPVLRAFSGPVLRASGCQYTFPEAGSRDALCRLIGTVVERVAVEPSSLSVNLTGGNHLLIPIDGSLPGGESAHFMTGEDHNVLVF